MNARAKVRLLFGPYTPPPLRRGDRAVCLYRDADVIITSWSAGRLQWPRCRALDSPGPGSGLLVNEELARAVRTESAAAVRYWWGVSVSTVWLWRQALGVTRTNNPGSRRLIHAAASLGAATVHVRGFTEEERAGLRQRALQDGRRPPPGSGVRVWTQEELALLGTAPDAEVAAQIGRTEQAVTVKRNRRGIPAPWAWTEAQVALLGTLPDAEVAQRTGRTVLAVCQKRCKLGIPNSFDGRKKAQQ